MFKGWKLQSFLALSFMAFAIGGCSPERSDPSVLGIQTHHQIRQDCLRLNLKTSTFTAEQIRAVSSCLNSHGDLGVIHTGIQSASEESLSAVAQWINSEILADPIFLAKAEKIFDELNRRKIIDDQFQALGELLRDQMLVEKAATYLKKASLIQEPLSFSLLKKLASSGERLFASPSLSELKQPLSELLGESSAAVLFEHQSQFAKFFRATHQAILISEESPFIHLLSSTENIRSVMRSIELDPLLPEYLNQLGKLLESGKLKQLIHTLIKLMSSKSVVSVSFQSEASKLETPALDLSRKGNHFNSETTLKSIHELFDLVQKNPKIIDATLSSFSHFIGRERDLAQWMMNNSDVIYSIEELVIQTDVNFPFVKNPAIRIMSEIGYSNRGPHSVTLEETFEHAKTTRDKFETLLFKTPLRWFTHSFQERIRKVEPHLPVLENQIHSIGLEFFRDLFYELDLVNPKQQSGLKLVTKIARTGAISAATRSIESLPKESEQLEQILKFMMRISTQPSLRDFFYSLSTTHSEYFFKTYDYFKANPSQASAIGSNIGSVLALAGAIRSTELDRFFCEMLRDSTDSFDRHFENVTRVLSHPAITESLK